MDYQVFISYRRDGGEVLSRMLYEELTRRGYHVFYDVESLRSGPFNSELLRTIDQCTDFLLVLPPGGLDRCSEPEDWVRAEVSHALRTEKNVIPILMRGFTFRGVDLPEDLAALPNLNGIEANMELFPAVLEKLTGKLMQTKPDKKGRRAKTGEETDQKEGPPLWKIFLYLALSLLAPTFLSRLYAAGPAFLPGPLHDLALSLAGMSTRSILLTYAIAQGIVLFLDYGRNLGFKKRFPIGIGLDLEDLDRTINSFTQLLIEKTSLAGLEITTGQEEEEGRVPCAWSAREKGLLIRSSGGVHPDYLLQQVRTYERSIHPLYLDRMTTMTAAAWLLKDQGFDLVRQKDGRALYKKGDWKLSLAFGGTFRLLLALELTRDEPTPAFEEAAAEEESHTIKAAVRQAIKEIRDQQKKGPEAPVDGTGSKAPTDPEE